MRTIVLASSSPYRCALLDKLGLNFLQHAPNIDENPHSGESCSALVQRLATEKAYACLEHFPDAIIIGSDQSALLDGELLSKPGNADKACQQLQRASGRQVTFLTGLCVLDGRTLRHDTLCEPFSVHFRHLTAQQIARYIQKEQPLQCAGSFKVEGLGISLFERLEGDDPNTLIGLPLIQLIRLLGQLGIEIP